MFRIHPPYDFASLLRTIAALVSILSVSSALAQQVQVSVGDGPFFVGDSIRLQVSLSGFEDEPTVDIAGAQAAGLQVRFLDSGRRQFTQIINGRVVQNAATYNFSYSVEVAKAGKYSLGPFTAKSGGKTVTHQAISFDVSDIEINQQMKVDLVVPAGNFYPGQRVPFEIVWMFSGKIETIRSLKIQSEIFEEFKTEIATKRRSRNAIPVMTKQGLVELPAMYSRRQIGGETYQVLTAKGAVVADVPRKVELSPPVAICRKITGIARRTDPFDQLGTYQTVPQKAIGKPLTINIRPFPATDRPDHFNGAIGERFDIATSVNRSNFRVGDPISLQVKISGDGNLDGVGVPDLTAVMSDKQFDIPPESMGGVVAGDQKQFTIPIRIKDISVTQIPSIAFSWFDPQKEQYVSVESEPIDVTVLEGTFVSSNDVIRGEKNKGLESPVELASREQVSSTLDLSIVSDPEQFQRHSKNGLNSAFVYLLYVLGAIVVVGAVLDLRRMKPQTEEQRSLSRLSSIGAQIQSLSADEPSISQLCFLMRELQSVWGEDSDPEPLGRVDAFIGKCDAIAFRPKPVDQTEWHELLNTAQQLIEDIG